MSCCRRQEAYEKELEKLSVRRNPLGMDRHHRFYWCALFHLPSPFFSLCCGPFIAPCHTHCLGMYSMYQMYRTSEVVCCLSTSYSTLCYCRCQCYCHYCLQNILCGAVLLMLFSAALNSCPSRNVLLNTAAGPFSC